MKLIDKIKSWKQIGYEQYLYSYMDETGLVYSVYNWWSWSFNFCKIGIYNDWYDGPIYNYRFGIGELHMMWGTDRYDREIYFKEVNEKRRNRI